MKQAKLTILGLMAMVLLHAQDFTFLKQHPCAHSKIEYFKKKENQKDIVQSPLLFDYDVTFYHLDLTVSDTTTYIEGSVEIQAKATAEQLDTFAFELINILQVDSVLINGVNCSFLHTTDECFVIPEEPVAGNSQFLSKIYYHGTPPPGGFFNGVTTAYDSLFKTHVTWTLSEPFNARQWWPCKQVLDDKADSVWVFLTTDIHNKAGSNGLLTNEVLLPDNRVRYEWKSNYPIAYYLISFSVADYMDYSIYAKPGELNGDSILIQNYIYDTVTCLNQYKAGMDGTIEMIELFSDLYSLFPFYEEKYGHCLAEISGGMEHQTMTTLHEFGLLLVSHELGHSWFGDNVTCATWSDIWVNEGFATYTDYLAHEKIAGDPWPKIWMTNVHAYIMSEPDGSVYVPPEAVQYDNVERIFDSRLSYYKGALMLHMLRFELDDDDLFFQVYKNYQEKFSDSVATALDFLEVLNETTGQDFTYFWEQWYFGEGYPIYNMEWKQSGNVLEVTSNQSASAPQITPFYRMHFPLKIHFSDNTTTTIRLEQLEPEAHFNINVNYPIDSIQFDPDLKVLKKVVSINGIQNPATNPVIDVSPNPVNDLLNIRTAFTDSYEVSLLNLKGQVVKKSHFHQPLSRMDVAEMQNGIYLLKIRGNGKIYSQKILKQ